MKVKTTHNYSQFKAIEGNRSVNEKHVSRLMESMKEELLVSPIIVNEDSQVIDGQHRLEACKRLLLPVHYIVVDGYRRKQVQNLNRNSRNWSTSDFVDSMVSSGKSDYKDLKEFKERFGFPYTSCVILLSNNGNNINSGTFNKFKDGNFKVVYRKRGYMIAHMIEQMSVEYPFVKSTSFIGAFTKCVSNKGFKEHDFVKRVLSGNTTITKQGSRSQYLGDIERAYNYRLHNKINLRF